MESLGFSFEPGLDGTVKVGLKNHSSWSGSQFDPNSELIHQDLTPIRRWVTEYKMLIVPPIKDWNNDLVAMAGNVKEGRHRHVEMLTRVIVPPSIVVGRAKFGGCYGRSSTSEAPLRVSPINRTSLDSKHHMLHPL